MRALAGASDVYRARILETNVGLFGGKAKVEVVEVFKGSARPRAKLTLPWGGGGDCTIGFETGKTYLMYGARSAEDVRLCSRTREVADDDIELAWLRTGRLPPEPVALQRENVTCQPCRLEVPLANMVGSAAVWGEEALAPFRDGRSFWAHGQYDPNPTLEAMHRAVGISLKGRAFDLVERPATFRGDTCHERVYRRWCSGLELTPEPRGGLPVVRCTNPALEEVVCDENPTRVSVLGPIEELSAASCEWRDPAAGECKLSKEARPLAPGLPTYPRLVCRLGFDHDYADICHVEAAPHP